MRAVFSIGVLCGILAGCAPAMHANRPDIVDLSQFKVGEDNRLKVLTTLGGPSTSTKDGENLCEVYKLYTRGLGSVGKGVVTTAETVADVVTLGLAEVVLTPVEAATKNSKHPVVFCYAPDNKLVSVNVSDTAISD